MKGISTVVNRNDINTYNAKDVVGDTEFIEVGLLQRGTAVDSRLAIQKGLTLSFFFILINNLGVHQRVKHQSPSRV